MGTFKHHSYFAKDKRLKNYLLPNVCFVCRKCFRRPDIKKINSCPNCGGVMTALDRKFSAPKSNDLMQWKKVEYLVNNGFLFQSIYEPQQKDGKYVGHFRISYPKTLEEAIEFVAAYQYLIKK